jgi:DNA-binding NarL/FixJ family response regulator
MPIAREQEAAQMGTVLVHPTAASGEHMRRRLRLVSGASREPGAVRVALAAGSTLLRAAFRALLECEADVIVAGEAASVAELVELTGQARPDVVLMCFDGSLAGDPAEAIAQVAREPDDPAVQVIVLSSAHDDEQALAALRAGASGCLPLDTEPAELIRAVRLVAAGEAFLSPEATRSVIAELTAQPEHATAAPEPLEELTAREREVMALAAGGLSNVEISERLTVSRATAKTHVSRAMMKLRVRDRSQLVALAYRTGLVQPRGRPAIRADRALVLA